MEQFFFQLRHFEALICMTFFSIFHYPALYFNNNIDHIQLWKHSILEQFKTKPISYIFSFKTILSNTFLSDDFEWIINSSFFESEYLGLYRSNFTGATSFEETVLSQLYVCFSFNLWNNGHILRSYCIRFSWVMCPWINNP